MRFVFILILISIVAIIIAFILNILFRKARYVKYIPAVVLFSFMVYIFITMNSVANEGFGSLGRFVMGIFFLAACVSSLIDSVAMDIYHRIMEARK